MRGAHLRRDVGVAAIDGPDGEARVAGHEAVHCAVRQEGAVDVVGRIAGDGADHVRRICATGSVRLSVVACIEAPHYIRCNILINLRVTSQPYSFAKGGAKVLPHLQKRQSILSKARQGLRAAHQCT